MRLAATMKTLSASTSHVLEPKIKYLQKTESSTLLSYPILKVVTLQIMKIGIVDTTPNYVD